MRSEQRDSPNGDKEFKLTITDKDFTKYGYEGINNEVAKILKWIVDEYCFEPDNETTKYNLFENAWNRYKSFLEYIYNFEADMVHDTCFMGVKSGDMNTAWLVLVITCTRDQSFKLSHELFMKHMWNYNPYTKPDLKYITVKKDDLLKLSDIKDYREIYFKLKNKIFEQSQKGIEEIKPYYLELIKFADELEKGE